MVKSDAGSNGEGPDEDGSGRSAPHHRDLPVQEAKSSNDDTIGSEKLASRTLTALDDSWHNGDLKLSSKKKKPRKSIFADDDMA